MRRTFAAVLAGLLALGNVRPAAAQETRAAPPRSGAEPQAEAPLGWILIGAGGAVIATGAVFGLLALGARREADDECQKDGGQRLCTGAAGDAIDRDKRYSLFADLGFGLGAASAAIGSYILLTSPKKPERTAIVATARPRGGVVGFVANF